MQSLAVCSLVKWVVTEGWNCLETFSFIGDGCSVECEVGLEKSVLLGFHVSLVLHVQSVRWEGS